VRGNGGLSRAGGACLGLSVCLCWGYLSVYIALGFVSLSILMRCLYMLMPGLCLSIYLDACVDVLLRLLDAVQSAHAPDKSDSS
jgi:hypothetical protein